MTTFDADTVGIPDSRASLDKVEQIASLIENFAAIVIFSIC